MNTKVQPSESRHSLSLPRLAIILVNWNSYGVTSDCLKSLRDVDYDDFVVLVVDNGSADDSVESIKKEFPEVILIESEENLGFTGGNNLGIEYALDHEFELVMLLNNDTIVTPGFANKLVDTLMRDNSIGAIQPKILYNQERNIIWNAGGFVNRFFFKTKTRGLNEEDKGQYDELSNVDWITGCCFLTRTDIIKEVGPLDDRYFIYYEDGDWSFRISEQGYRLIYEPRSVIYHEVGMSNKNRDAHDEGVISPFTRYMVIRNHLYFVRRHAKGINIIGVLANQTFKVSGYICYYLIKRRFTKLRSVFRGVKDGLKN